MLVMFLSLLWLMRARGYRRYELYTRREKIDKKLLRQLLTLSVPICLTLLFEAGLFTATAVQMKLVAALADSDGDVRLKAMSAITNLEIIDDQVVAKLLDEVASPKLYIKHWARRTSKKVIKKLVLDNHSEVMFDYKLIPKEQIK